MTMNFAKAIYAVAAVLVPLAVHSQNLNPTVEVTNIFEGSAAGIRKPSQTMAVPDSVMKFNLDFDYSVFDNPYKGAYEFSPYLISLKPHPDAYDGKDFYLKAGAGYTLHPELKLVWIPRMEGRFKMNVFADHSSYFGKYRTIAGKKLEDGLYRYGFSGDKFRGHDSFSKVGAGASYSWKGGIASLGVAYGNLHVKDTLRIRGNNAVTVTGGVRSHDFQGAGFFYDARASYTYERDCFSVGDPLNGSTLVFDGSFGPLLDSEHRLLMDVDMTVSSLSGALQNTIGVLSVAPKYLQRTDRWYFSLGVKLSAFLGNYSRKSQIVYPDVKVEYEVIRDYMVLYALIGGGNTVNTYRDVLMANHHFNPWYACQAPVFLDSSVERVNAALGVRGNIARRFQYDLDGGYARRCNDLLDAVLFDPAKPLSAAPAIGYSDYNLAFVNLRYSWRSRSFEADGKLSYKATDLARRVSPVFAPAAFSGNASFLYRWKDRIGAGISCEFATARRARPTETATVRIPGYADVGLVADYMLTRKVGFWLRAGNLLGSTIQRIPFYSEDGVYGTGGIYLTF